MRGARVATEPATRLLCSGLALFQRKTLLLAGVYSPSGFPIVLMIFESILPIFLLVVAGAAFKRLPFIDRSFWPGMEQFGFYIIFPLFLFLTLSGADFADVAIGPLSLVYSALLAVLAIALIAAWPVMARMGINGAQFTTIFQTATRWNGFVAMAIAERLYGQTGVAIVAVLMGAIVIPINLANIFVLVWYGGGERHLGLLIKKVLSNPIVLATFFGLVFAVGGIEIYMPIEKAIDLIARSALGLGLIMVGAGLRLSEFSRPTFPALLGVVLKLIVFPAAVIGATWWLGFDATTIKIAALSASVPTAMNGYLLAKQMGGDAPLYAATATLQTAASFFTIPAVVAVAEMVAAR
ncbi:AEC family transporter [Rhizobium sp. L1K21]|uniref:AEC family transporter n=1 Tax=Rhizobium sp. L1K21 TaxID=2954933 RepID=UPI00209395DB|nr:AEC family transporter [Rhizobium sp. L1K21]MCO6186462.1 AEC family transporter [Rhizobium sp. L1K21]